MAKAVRAIYTKTGGGKHVGDLSVDGILVLDKVEATHKFKKFNGYGISVDAFREARYFGMRFVHLREKKKGQEKPDCYTTTVDHFLRYGKEYTHEGQVRDFQIILPVDLWVMPHEFGR